VGRERCKAACGDVPSLLEGQTKQFYQKDRSSLKAWRGIASLHNALNWDDPETKGDPSDKIEHMCEEAANYYVYGFGYSKKSTGVRTEPLLAKRREKELSDIDKTR
jgi:hypothetical protein